MKKSKILFPALGVLVLSAGAAVTGTVAWFTANLQATMASSNVTVVKSGSNLTAIAKKLESDFGVDVGNGSAVTHSQFVDGSVNMVTGDVYKALFNDKGDTCKGFQTVAKGQDDVNSTQFRATKFTVELSMQLEDEIANTKYGVYVDPSALSPLVSTVTTASATDAEKALRVGFKTAGQWVIWAPYLDSTQDEAELKYVNSTTVGSDASVNAYTTKYSVDDRILSTAKTQTTYGTTSNLYLGDIVRIQSADKWKNTLNVEIYTWFEGAELVNLSTGLNTGLSYTVAFNAVKAPAAGQ